MRNPKTTLAGALTLLGALAYAVAKFLNGETPDLAAVLAAITGLGLIGAADGGK